MTTEDDKTTLELVYATLAANTVAVVAMLLDIFAATRLLPMVAVATIASLAFSTNLCARIARKYPTNNSKDQ